jgi:type III restriction enzyme
MTAAPSPQFQYTRLEHQTQAVDSLARVFENVHFVPPAASHANPTWVPARVGEIIEVNLRRIRADNSVTAGTVAAPFTATPALNLDVLMETGTGKTFTFIETMHRLHQQYKLSKFIVLVPSNAIRQGTLKSLQTTAAFFAREYNNQKINVFDYSERTVAGFVNAANAGISVLVATFNSFNKQKNVINKRGVEANLFGQAKSYMEGLAALRPVLIIDEPHRAEGEKTQEYLPKFNPLLTIRFGATFKDKEYKNLVYTLDSVQAFRKRLVKGITVDTVGAGQAALHTLELHSVSGTTNNRVAHLGYQKPDGKTGSVELVKGDNLGEKAGLSYLSGHVVETVTAKELRFTNGFSVLLGEAANYGVLADEVQQLIIKTTIANHFEREEDLFKRGIKALSLFFIDSVGKYLPEGNKPAVLRDIFEREYAAHLAQVLAKADLDADYRAYLERTQSSVQDVHKGYFARSLSEKGQEEAVQLILKDKERLLSFDTDLRFIFSMWALQEGWDNPNIFTLCKLAPSDSSITKLQQIGRGLRLAVNQRLERIESNDPAFDAVNELVVVVPQSEGDFVKSIQDEIKMHSVGGVAAEFDGLILHEFGVAPSAYVAIRVLDMLAELKAIDLNVVSGKATLRWTANDFEAQREKLKAEASKITGMTAENGRRLVEYFDQYFGSYGQIKHKVNRPPQVLKPRAEQFAKFKQLWQELNRDAVLKYELNTPQLIENVLTAIGKDFNVRPLTLDITRTEQAQDVNVARSTQASYTIKPHAIYSLSEFVRELSQGTRLSMSTVCEVLKRMPANKFALIAKNENRALAALKDICLNCVYDIIVNTVSYHLREVRIKTGLTDAKGHMLAEVAVSEMGKDLYPIDNSVVQQHSLYAEPHMPIDSAIEGTTVDESHHQAVQVFAKLPRIRIPTPTGEYNPDFGYVVQLDGKPQAMYLVVETKGYDAESGIATKEKRKIESARRFFAALKERGVPVTFETKLNQESLAQLIAQMN